MEGLIFLQKQMKLQPILLRRLMKLSKESDVLIWLLSMIKITDLDQSILKMLRAKDMPPIIVVANKADNESAKLEAFSLPVVNNFHAFYPASVSHHTGFVEIKICCKYLKRRKWFDLVSEELDESFIKLSLVETKCMKIFTYQFYCMKK